MTPDNLNTATLGVRPKKGQNPITSNLSQLNIMTCYTCPPLTLRTIKIPKHYPQAVFRSLSEYTALHCHTKSVQGKALAGLDALSVLIL